MGSYFDELKRRNVFRVAAAYAVVGWLAIEVVDTLAPRMGMPDWVPGMIILLLLIGFPIALLLSWAFEMTPEGIKKTADVEVDASITSTTGQRINYLIIAALATALLVQQFSPSLSRISPFAAVDAEPIGIAVLPFADLSAAGDQEYLGDGVAEEILNVLAGVDGLKVTSRTSAFAFKQQSRSIPEIAGILGVSHVVEGSIRKQDDRVRITAQLIDVSDDSHLWSETYDANLTDIFRLQDEIAVQIAAALSQSLQLALPNVVRETPDWNVGAYELYLRARQLVVERRDNSEALELIDAALKLEPGFADAWAEKATAQALEAFNLGLEDETIDAAFAEYDQAWLSARRATELQPDHPLGLAVQGLIRLNQKRWIEAQVYFDRALAVDNPSDYAYLWHGILKVLVGDFDGALASFDAGLEESPTAPNLIRWRLRLLTRTGNWPAIWAQRDKPSAITMVDTEWTLRLAGLRLGEIGLDEVESWVREQNNDAGNVRSILVFGATEPTISALRSVFGDSPTDIEPAYFLPYIIDSSQAILDVRPDVASAFFEMASDSILTAPNRMDTEYAWVSEMAGYRRTDAFRQLVSALSLPAYWDLYGWPPMCERIGIDDFACQ